MKQYIKPTTSVNEIALTTYMIGGSNEGKSLLQDGGGTGSNNVTEAGSKSRDVWSEGYW
ncbi:MAG: hypothetical protein IJ528_04930 [Bacteroidaceae bacterium]|nr:hypothetical protein [Bacteroidaceae bacterium]